MSTINERIAQCIAETGLTKTAFAQKINLSQPHMSKITRGHSMPTDRTIADICREFNVDETWLRTGTGEMFREPRDVAADRLAAEYSLDDLGCQILSAYLKLDENDRLALGRLIQNIMDERTPLPVVDTKDKPIAFSEAHVQREQLDAAEEITPPTQHASDTDIEAEVDAYRQRLILEKKQALQTSVAKERGAG